MMGGNPRDLARQMQQMQTRLAKIQEELGSETVEASVGGGMVTIVMTGHQNVESVNADDTPRARLARQRRAVLTVDEVHHDLPITPYIGR